MLFNSYQFIFVFLPVALLGFHLLNLSGWPRGGWAWLVAASFFFYGWWNWAYLILLGSSIAFNYTMGRALRRETSASSRKKALLVFGVCANIGLLVYFKYTNFLLDNINWAAGSEVIRWVRIALPLGISFITFQKIAYLVDAYRGEAADYDFLGFCLFVTFFPQLIAGPIVHHREFIPQVTAPRKNRIDYTDLAVGFTIFIIGLFKKVVIADTAASYASPGFTAVENGVALSMLEAWGAVLGYTLQIYFDFSGYSDMAVGLARVFGIRLPMNFFSPYKAGGIIEFWRRWHITLSRFLRDYLYISLGGNRKGEARRYVNLFLTMAIGGIWHGAGWTFAIWGVLHGTYLIINHAWRVHTRHLSPSWALAFAGRCAAHAITFLAIVIAWVFFRAASAADAMSILVSMSGAHGLVIPPSMAPTGYAFSAFRHLHLHFEVGTTNYFWGKTELILYATLFAMAWCAPNTTQLMARFNPALMTADWTEQLRRAKGWYAWHPTAPYAVLTGVAMVIALVLVRRPTEFIYFQF